MPLISPRGEGPGDNLGPAWDVSTAGDRSRLSLRTQRAPEKEVGGCDYLFVFLFY